MTDSKLVVDPALNYVTKVTSLRQPKYVQLPISITPTLSLASTSTATWVIPPSVVFNLSESLLEFTWTTAASGIDALLGFSLQHCDVPPIQGISLISETGTVLYQNDRVLEMIKLVQPLCTKMSDFQQRGDITEGQQSGLARSNALPDVLESKEIPASGGAPVNALYPYMAVRHFRSSGVNNTAISTSWAIRGKDLYFTGLADPHLQFHGGKYLTLQVTFVQGNKVDWKANDSAQAGKTVHTINPTISGLRYMLAVEHDEATRQSVVQQVMAGGLSYMVPAVQSYDVSLDAAASQSRQVVLNASNGKSLLAVVSAVAQVDDQKGLTCNVYDAGDDSLWTSKRMSINNVFLQNESQNAATYYRQHKAQFEGSLVNTAAAHLRHKVWAESFSGLSFPELAACNGNISGGLDLLTGPLSIGVDLTKATAARYHWLFCLVNRYYSMTPAGPIVSNVPLA